MNSDAGGKACWRPPPQCCPATVRGVKVSHLATTTLAPPTSWKDSRKDFKLGVQQHVVMTWLHRGLF